MLKSRNRILLPVVIFLFTLSAQAEIIGGHDRQRFMLLLTESLQQHYQQNPLKLYLPELPVEVAINSSDDQALYSILLTLSEEGLLVEKKKTSELISESGRSLITAVSEFSVPAASAVPEVDYGTVVIDEVTSVQALDKPGDELSRYQVQFLWHLTSPAEWLWAPRLNDIREIRLLRASTAETMNGSARFIWHNATKKWRLEETPNIYSP